MPEYEVKKLTEAEKTGMLNWVGAKVEAGEARELLRHVSNTQTMIGDRVYVAEIDNMGLFVSFNTDGNAWLGGNNMKVAFSEKIDKELREKGILTGNTEVTMAQRPQVAR